MAVHTDGLTFHKSGHGSHEEKDLDELLSKFIRWKDNWSETTIEWRRRAQRDIEYYHGNQLTDVERQDLKDRGQPIVIKNRIAKKINFLIGNEIANRTDPKALPRTRVHDSDVNAVTDALRYVMDNENFDRKKSASHLNLLLPGIAGISIEHEVVERKEQVTSDVDVERTNEGLDIGATRVERVTQDIEIRIRKLNWDRLWYDPHSRESDFSDATYLGTFNWMYVDQAIGQYGKRDDTSDDFADIIKDAKSSQDTDLTEDDRPRWTKGQGRNKRVKITEVYYDEMIDGQKQCFVAHYTASGFIVPPKRTGYLDEYGNHVCPLRMASAYVTDDGERYGVSRNMIDPQDEINKRSSKALHLLSVAKVIAEEGAVNDPDQAQTEYAKPDGWVEVQPGALIEGRLQFINGTEMAQGQMQLLQEAKAEIESIGPELPSIGNLGGETSGRALQQRQAIGALELAGVNDNLRGLAHEVYTHSWLRIRQFWTGEKWLRVTDETDDKGYKFTGINQRMTKGDRLQQLLDDGVEMEAALPSIGLDPSTLQQVGAQVSQSIPGIQQMPPEQAQQIIFQQFMQSPMMQQKISVNDLASLDIDIVIDESPDVAVIQQEEAKNLADLAPSLINAGMDPRDITAMVIEAGQLRSKKKLLGMLRKPPDQAAAQAQAQQQQLQMAAMQAQIADLQAKAELNQAKAQSEQANTQFMVPADVQLKEAQAMNQAADAGVKSGE